MDERDAINEERKIRFSVNPRWPLVSKKKKDVFFHAGSESVWGRVKFRRIETVATTVEKQRRLNFSRNPFNSPRRGELIGTPEPGININDLVVT